MLAVQRPPKLILDNGLRLDGRRSDEMRPIKIELGVLKNADGSALFEMGNTKVLAAVYGPREMHPRHMSLPDRAVLRVRYHMTPFSTDERKNPVPSRREIELSKVIREALEAAVLTELFPRAVIDVFMEVLQADAGTRLVSLMSASMALADAGIPMKDLIAGVAIGKADGQLVLDLNEPEDMWGEADMPIAMMPSLEQVVLFQLNGNLTPQEYRKALEMAVKGINTIYSIEREAIKSRYIEYKEEV